MRRSRTLAGIRRYLRVPVTALLLATFFGWSSQSQAATYYWDVDGSNVGNTIGGTNLGGTGVWNTSLQNWWDATNPDLAWPNAGAPGDTAIFTGTAGVVTTGSPLNANNLTFNSSGYTLTGNSTNSITLLGTTPGVTLGTGVTGATITALLAGAGGLAFNGGAGSGTLTLGATANANSYTGSTGISSGTLRTTSLTALGASGAGNGTTVNSGGALRIGIGGTTALELLTLNGTGVAGGGALVLDANLASTWSGAITLGSASTINVASGATLTQSTTLMTLGTGTDLTKTGSGTFALTLGSTAGTGALNVNDGTFQIAAGKWNSGAIAVASGGRLLVSGAGTDSIGAFGVTVNSGGALDWQATSATADALGAVVLNGTGINGSGAWTSGTAGGQSITPTSITLATDTAIGGAGALKTSVTIGNTGAASFTKVGTGTFTNTVTSGTPFGSRNIVLNGGTLALVAGAISTPTGASTAGDTFTYGGTGAGGGGTLTMTRFSATAGVTYTVGNATSTTVLQRSNRGTLVLNPSTSLANLGAAAASGGERFIVLGTALPGNLNGIADSSIVASSGNVGSFVNYSGTTNGFVQAAYTTAVNATTIAANTISDVTSSIAINATSNPYALRVGGFTLTNSGTTTVNGGAFSAGVNSGLGGIIMNAGAATPANDSVITGGTLAFGSSEATIFTAQTTAGLARISSAITGSAGLTKFGPGPLTLDGVNSGLSGGVQLNQGTLNINSATALGSGTFTIKDGTTINNSSAAALTLTANNAVALDGNFTFTGTQSLNLGTGAVTMTGNRTITANTAANALTLGGAITGSGTLTKLGTGQLTLSGSNTGLTGGVTLGAGTLNINNANALGTSAGAFNITAASTINNTSGSAITNAGNNPINIVNTGAVTLTFTGSNALNLGTGAVTLGGGTLTINNSGAFPLTFGGNVGDNGENIGILTNSPGLVVLGGSANTFTGAISITNGAVSMGSIADGVTYGAGIGNITTTNATGTPYLQYTGAAVTLTNRALNLSTLTTGSFTLDASGSGAINLANTAVIAVGAGNGKTVVLRGSNTGSNTLAGIVQNNSGTNLTNLTKFDRGQWVLTNNNTYTGATTVNAGTLKLDASINPLITPASGIIAATSALTLGGGTLSVTGATAATTQSFASTALTTNTMSSLTATAGAGGLTVNTGAITRAAASGLNISLSGSPTLNYSVGAAGWASTNGLNVSATTGAAFMTLNSTDWANGVATPVASTYTNDTFTASTNNINVTTAGAWAGTSLNTLRFNTGAPTLTLTGTNALSAGGILIGSGAGAVNFGGASSTGTVSGTAFTTASGELNIFNYSASTATINAGIINNTSSNSYLAAAPVGNTLSIFGSGTTILNASRTATTFANAYTGGTNISGSSTLQLGVNNAIPFGTPTPGVLSISGGATLDLNGKNQIVNGIQGLGIVNNTTATAATFTIGSTNAASTFSGSIQNTGGGAVSLVKTGSGSITLNGQNTYTGGTTISQGTVLLNFTTSPVNVRNNILPATALTLGSGTLNVTGQVAGTSINVQSFSSTTLNGGGSVTSAGTTPAVTVSFGAISRAAGSGGTLNLTNGTGSTGFYTTTSTNNAAGILGGHITVGAADWGTVNASGNIVAAPAGTALPAGGVAADANGNYLLTANQTQSALSVINSLKITGTTTLTTGTFPITFSGTNGGLLTTGTTVISGTGAIGAGVGNEFLIYNAGTLTVNAPITSGALTKSGAGTLNLRTIASNITGTVTINQGTLDFDAANRLGTSTLMVLNGGTATIGAFSLTQNLSLGAAGGTLSQSDNADRTLGGTTAMAFVGTGPRALTITQGRDSRVYTLPMAIGDADATSPTSIILNGGGDVAILRLNPAAANTYTGNTIISRGVLRLATANAVNGAGGLLSTATTGNIMFTATGVNRAILETSAAAGTISRSVGYGPGQIHWEGNGGFSNNSAATQVVNLGGAGAMLTWGVGGFVPNGTTLGTGNLLQFGQAAGNSNFSAGSIDFQNAINLGASSRGIDVSVGTVAELGAAFVQGILSGALTNSAGGGLTKTGPGALLVSNTANSGGTSGATVLVNQGTLLFSNGTTTIPGSGANITLSTTAGGNSAFGVIGDTNPISTLGARIANPSTATAAFVLGASSSVALDFTSYPNMRLAAFAFTAGATPTGPALPTSYSGTITPGSNGYRFGGVLSMAATSATTNSAGTLILPVKNQLTGSSAVNFGFGQTTVTASNNYTGATTFDGNAVASVRVGIGSNTAFGTSALTLGGTQATHFGTVNGDHTVSNLIAFSGSSTGNWEAGSNPGSGGILANTTEGTLSYLGTIDGGGRSNPNIVGRRSSLFLGDIGNLTGGVNFTQGSGGYMSSLTTAANGGIAKTYSGTTTLGDNAIFVIDSNDSFGNGAGGTGAIAPNTAATNTIVLLQPGTGSISLLARPINVTAAGIVTINTPSGSTLTTPSVISGFTTGRLLKTGLGELVLTGLSPTAITTGSLDVRAGKLTLDAATAGGTVWGATGQGLTLGAASGTFTAGGTLAITGTSAQAFGGVTVNPRANAINLTGTMALTLGAITRTTGSTLNFAVPTGTVNYTTAGVRNLVNGATTWNGNDWAKADGTNIGQFTAYDALTGTASAPTITTDATAATTRNYIISSATTNDVTLAAVGTLAAPNNANTIKYSDTAARTIDLRSAGTAGFLRLGAGGAAGGGVTNAGGILVANGAGALTIGVAVGATGGSIMAGGTTTNTLGDLVFINNSTSDITVNSAIIPNNGTTGTTPVVYNGMSTGKLILAGNNTFTGAVIVNSGTLEVATVNSVAAAGPLGQGTAAVGNILLNGGTFRAALSANGATDKGFTVNAPSTIEVVANTLTLNTTLNGLGSSNAQLGILNAGILKKTGAGTLELKNLGTNATNANLSIEVVAGTLLLNKISTATISAIDLAGGAGLIIDGHATVSPTVLISGTGGNQISDTSSVVVNSGTFNGVLDLNGLSETIDGLAGTGTVTNNVTGTSTLSVGGNNSAGLSPYTLAAAAAGVNATGLNSFGGVIQDGGAGKVMALTKVGSGTQILSAAQAYSGATTISAGTLQLGIANALPSGVGKSNVAIAGNNVGTNVGAVATNGSDKVLAPGTLDMGGYDQAINGLDSTTGGFVTNNPTLAWNGTAWAVAAGRQGTKTLTLGTANANGAFNGVIQNGFSVAPGLTTIGHVGAINLVKIGTGNQTLSGSNTFTGSTSIQNGTLSLAGGANRLPVTTSVILGSGSNSGLLKLGDSTGAVTQTIAALSTSGSGTTNAVVGGNSLDASNSTLIVNQTGSSTYSGALGGAAPNQNKLNFTLQGGGTLTVDGTSNTLAGTTTVQGASTLILNSDLASSAITVGGASAGTLVSNQTLGSLLTVGNGGVVAPGDLLASDIGTLTLAGGLTLNAGGVLAMQIGSTATLTTPLVNDIFNITGGLFTVNGGQLSLTELSPGASIGALLSAGPGNYNLIDYSGATNAAAFAAGSQFSNLGLTSSVIGANNYYVTLVHDTANKIIQLNVDNARFWSGATDGQWNTSVANWSPVNPALYLNTDKVIFQDTYPVIGGNANVVNTSIDLTTAVTPAAMTFNNTSVNYTVGGSGSIGGATGLTKSGTGSLVITNANTFTGNTIISGGYLEMQHADALGTAAGSISVGNGAALRLTGGIAVGAKATALTGTGIANSGALRNVSGNNSLAGAITLGGTTRINSDAGLLTLSGGITNGANNLIFGGAGNITESGVIGSGAGSLTVDGTGVVTLSNAANTYTGQTFIKSGTLSVPNIGSVGVAGGLGAPAITEATIAIGDAATTGTLKWTGSANESTDRVIDLAGTTGGATLDASGTGGSVLTIAMPMTFTGAGSKTLTLTGTGGNAGTPNVITGAVGDPSGFATSLLKTDSGAWRLNGANNYTGSTTINGGALVLGSANGLPTTAPTIANGSSSASLNLNGLNQTLNGVTFGGASATSTGQGSIVTGAGILTLGGDITYTATGNPLGASISGNVDLGGAARSLIVDQSSSAGGSDLTISAIIADTAATGSLVKTGTGTAVLTGANTYIGATTISGGTLSVSPAAIATTSTLDVGTTANAALSLYADNAIATATLASNTNLNVGGATSVGALGFQLSGATGDRLNLAGTGALTVGAGGGLINARALAALTPGSFTLLDNTNLGASTITGFNLGVLTGGYTYALDNATGGLLKLTVGTANAGPYIWNGSLSSSWATLASGGTSTNWRLNQNGTGEAGATPGGVDVTFVSDTAANVNTTLDQPYSITGLSFVSNTSGTGNPSIAAGSGDGSLTIGANGITVGGTTNPTISAPVILAANQSWSVITGGQTLTVSGVISGNGYQLNKQGLGTLVLSGANTYDGSTSISDGIIQISSASSLGATTGALQINAGTLQATADITDSRTVNLASASSTILVDATKTLSIVNTGSSLVLGAGTLNATGAGSLVLDDRLNANTFSNGSVLSGGGTVRVFTNTGLGSGATTINAATLRVSGTYSDGRNVTLGNAASAISVDAGQTLTILNTGATKVTGGGSLNASGAGTLVLNDGALVNDYTGPTVITGGGTVQIGTDTALGNASGAVSLGDASSTGTLSVIGAGSTSVTTARNFSLGSTGGIITVGTADTYTANGVLSNLTTLGKLTANGNGTLKLFGVNTYTGGTTIGASALVNAGIVQTNSADSLGNGGTATLRNATLQATQSYTDTRAFNLESFGSKISVDPTMTLTLSGLVADGTQAGTLNQLGTGTLNLTRAAGNTYTGGTFVTGGGTLRVNNTTGSGTGTGIVSVTGAGSTLAGSGLITGATSIGSGAILAPGNSAGTITIASLTLASGSLLNYELGAIASSDKTVVTATNGFTANGGQFSLTALAGLTSGTYNLITYAGTLGGSFSNLSLASNYITGGGTTFYASLVNNTGSVDLTTTSSLTWNGNIGGSIWDNGITANTNWKSGANTNLSFFNTMTASFDDTATSYTVNLPGTVSPGSIVVNAANDYLIQGAGAITGSTGITKSGGGTLVIDTANPSMTGNIAINAGAIEMTDVAALGTGNIAITAGASLRLNDTGIALGSRITSYSGGAAIENVSGINTATLPAVTLTAATSFLTDAGKLTLAGNIVSNSLAVSLIGTGGDIELTGTTISGGNFNFTSNMTGGTATIANNVNPGTSGVVVNGSGATIFNGNITSSSTGNGLVVSSSGTNTFNGNVTVSGTNGSISLGGSSTNTFAATSNTAWNGTGTASISSSGNTIFNGTISGSGGLTKSGAGTLTFNATSASHSGGVTMSPGSGANGGVIVVNANGALGTGAVTSVFATGALTAQFQLTGGRTLTNNFTTSGAGTNGSVDGLIRAVTGANVLSGPVTMTGGGGSSTYRADTGASLAFNGSIGADTSTFRIITLVGGGDFIFGSGGSIAQTLTTGGSTGLWSTNSGTTTINSTANTYALATGIGNGSTLVIADLSDGGVNSSIGAAPVAATNLVIDNGTLQYSGSAGAQSTNRLFSIGDGGATLNASGAAATDTMSFTGTGALGFNGISGVGTSALETGARTLTLTGTNTGANSLASVIGDQAAVTGITSLTKSGAGTWSLSGVSTYTGATTISGGKLTITSTGSINGTSGVSIGAAEFNYNSSTALTPSIAFTSTLGKLTGSGTINSAFTVSANNTLAPGNSIGTLSFGAGLTVAGTYAAELGTAGATPAAGISDLAAVTGNLDVTGGTLSLLDNAGANAQGSAGPGAYRLMTFTGSLTGTFATVTNPMSATLHEKVIYDTNSVDLNIYRLASASAHTPEPVALGNVHMGSTAGQALTLSNTATNDGFSEKLNGSFTGVTGDVTSSGTFTALNAGSSSTALNVNVNTATVGAKSGTATIGLQSNGTGTSGYGNTSIGTQTVNVTGTVYSGAMIWSGASGSFGTHANWDDSLDSNVHVAPGLDAGFTGVDTATFGNTAGSVTVSLNGASPSLNAITFNNTGSYTLAQGSSGSITLAGTTPAITVAGTHEISAPMTLAANTAVSVATSGAVIFSGGVGESGGARSVTKSGDGILNFTAPSTYSGGTTVSAGTVLANNSTGSALGTGNVLVSSAGTLGGSGAVVLTGSNSITINGALVVGNTSDTVGADLDLSTVTASGSTIFGNGSAVFLDIFGGDGHGVAVNNTHADVLRLFGDLTIGTGVTLTIGNPNALTAWAAGDTFQLFDWSALGTLTGTFGSVDYSSLGLTGGLDLNTSSLYTTGLVSIISVPEPSRALLLMLGLLGLLVRRRRSCSRAL